MRVILTLVSLLIFSVLSACSGDDKPASPVESLKAYTIAVKNKDITMMKLLLSEASLKLHQDEAKSLGMTLDEVVEMQTLFPADQRVFDYKNEKIDGNKATVEVKNAFGGWDTIHLVLEAGVWKIDRKSTSDQIIDDVEEQNRKLDEMMERSRQETEGTEESPAELPATEGATPTPASTGSEQPSSTAPTTQTDPPPSN